MNSGVIAPLFDSDARILSLLGIIGSQEINITIDHLLRLDGESPTPITIFINSQGGSMIEALKVLDTFTLLQAPLTAVGLGYIEGAGSLILAGAQQRVLYPSCALSLAGLWDLPDIHPKSRRAIGIHEGDSVENQLLEHSRKRVRHFITTSKGRLPEIFADTKVRPQILDACDCITLGFADAVIEGPDRVLTQSIKTKLNLHAKISPSSIVPN